MTFIDSRSSNPGLSVRPLVTFLVLGFALSWYPWALHLMGRPGNGGPNPLGLLLAALTAAYVDRGWAGSRRVLASIIRLRAPLPVWSAVILVPVVSLAIACALAAAAGVTLSVKPPPWSDLLDKFIIMFFFVGLGEEPSWRGFLLPLLQRSMTPFFATLVVAVVWAVWHLPLMGSEFAWSIVPAFLVSLLGAAFVQSWLYNASGGSSLLPMALHGFLNTIGSGYVFTLIARGDLLTFWWIYALVWLGLGAGLVVLTRGCLGLRAS